MTEVDTLEKTSIKSKTKTKEKVGTLEEVERQTIVHCSHFMNPGDGIRVWRTTFLIESPSGKKRKLLHAENITMHPTWTVADKSGFHRFTLYFEGLSKTCSSFDLVEEIPQPGGFFIKDIIRNNSDVYKVEIE